MEACRTTGLVSLFLLLFWLLIPGHIHGQQTSEQEKYHVDSTLFVYYQHCKTEIKSPSVMQMLDTLFLMAKEKGDLRMQAVAISSKTDHFYFGPSFEDQGGQPDIVYQHHQRLCPENQSTSILLFCLGQPPHNLLHKTEEIKPGPL